ncbi:uncharacterized protein [Watersipora subatra]|uniref:uncharacterized protein n=1 Tax=Watersipora subatra TaxID=2589382 RepID=UPI00355B1629
MAISLLANESVCFTTTSGLYCHQREFGRKSTLKWKKDLLGVTSIASNEYQIFAATRTDKLMMVDGTYTCWNIHILDDRTGSELRQIFGGLGQECSITALPCGWLALADTGNYGFHAQPCIILMTEYGKERQVLTPMAHETSLVKPTKVVVNAERSKLVVFDGGANYLIGYDNLRTTLRTSWKLHAKNYVSMTVDSTNSVIVAAMRFSTDIMTFDGEVLSRIDLGWNREMVRDISVREKYLAASEGKEACIYRIVNVDDAKDDIEC